MYVSLVSYSPYKGDLGEDFLDRVASQSRNEKPKSTAGLFKKTKEWGHDSIQEFADYTFRVEGVSTNLLKQLTRHRIASYNVMSHRHVPPSKVVFPEGINYMEGKIELDDGGTIYWESDRKKIIAYYENRDGNLANMEDCPIPLEDIRYGFPTGMATNLFMKFNGRSLRNFLRLRMDKHAQWEIRDLANIVFALVKEVHPYMVDDL